MDMADDMEDLAAYCNEMVTDSGRIQRMLADDLLFDHRRAEQIMAMPAAQRRWTAHESWDLRMSNHTMRRRRQLLSQRLTSDAKWLKLAGNPHVRRIDSGNHPNERGHIIEQFAPVASASGTP